MRQFAARKEVKLYFNCYGRMDRIIRTPKRVDYRDFMFTMEVLRNEFDGKAKLKVKFGRGWMGKNAEVYWVNNLKGEPKGIIVSITISESTFPYDCCIENMKDKEDVVYLGEPSDIIYPFTWRFFPHNR
jgi:hypothetical protein